VIVATHLPFLNRGLFFARTAPRRHPVIAVRSNLPPLEGMYLAYDGSHPHSVRTQPLGDGQVLIVGGESWKTAHVAPTSERWQSLIMQAREHLAVESVEYRWGAQDHYSADLLPFMGKLHPLSEGLYTATGFGAWGMTNGAAAGLLLTDLVLGRPNDWSEVFDPNRLNVRASARKLVTENMDNASRILLPRLRPPRGILASVHEGQGRVIEHDGRRMAVSRDSDGSLRAVSPSCGHLGCIVAWNDAEQTWDCPCHGSRYTATGEVLEGPTLKGLERIELP
jgi:Rieske Fe-S protein